MEKTKFKRELDRRGIKNKWVAEGIGISTQTVTSWAKGYAIPSSRHMAGLAKVLGLSLAETYAFFDDENFNLKVIS